MDLFEKPVERGRGWAGADDGLSFAQSMNRMLGGGRFEGTPEQRARAVGEALRDVWSATDRHTMFVENMFSHDSAVEEAFDRRIKAIKDATGVELLNPMRDRKLAPERLPEFASEVEKLRAKHPDKPEVTVGDVEAEARAIAKGAEHEYQTVSRETKLAGPAYFLANVAGGITGMRRDPFFIASFFAGPQTAIGRTVATRIADYSIKQGLYNAGLAALEQPIVQAWRAEIGAKSGIDPAIENVGMAFLSGAILGAPIRAGKEILDVGAMKRVLAGNADKGDIERVYRQIQEAMAEIDRSGAVRTGETKITITGETRTVKLGEAAAPEAPSAVPARREPLPDIPPVEEGFVRFFHGGPPEGGEPPTTGMGRWTSTDYTYARDYRSSEGQPGQVWYVDIPKGDKTEVAARAWDETMEGTSQVGTYRSIEIPEEWAKRMKPYNFGERPAAKLPDMPQAQFERELREFKERDTWEGGAGWVEEGDHAGRLEARAIRLGDEIDEAAKVTAPEKPAVATPELHEDLTAAALRHGDDPLNEPSPAGVAYVEAQTPVPPAPAPTSLKSVVDALDAMKAEQGGISTTWIGDLQRRLGVPLEELHALLREEAAAGNLQLTFGARALSNISPEHRAAALHVDDQSFHQVTATTRGREAAKTAPAQPREGVASPEWRRTETGGFEVAEGQLPAFNDLGDGYSARMYLEPSGDVRQEIRTPEGNVLIRGVDRDGRELYREFEFASADPLGRGSMEWVDRALEKLSERSKRPKLAETPRNAEVDARIAEARPENVREAQMAATEAIEDIGNRQHIARTTEALERDRLPEPPPPKEGEALPPVSSKALWDVVPLPSDDGKSVRYVSARAAAQEGAHDLQIHDLIQACKP